MGSSQTSLAKRYRTALRQLDRFESSLTRSKITQTTDSMGRVTAVSKVDTSFDGDLQYGTFLDKNLIEAGWVEQGDAVLYVRDNCNVSDFSEGDNITDGGSIEWEITGEIEDPKIGGLVIHKVFKCKRVG